jgi:hypothetical protein
MRPLIRIATVIYLICLSVTNLIAGNGSVKPVNSMGLRTYQIKHINAFLSANLNDLTDDRSGEQSADHKGRTARICSCQILDLASSNYTEQRVVLLAEKTSQGSSKDYVLARKHLQKEKKHLKEMFYDKVKVVAESQSTGSCKSFYFKLKTADSGLQLYEILDADIN